MVRPFHHYNQRLLSRKKNRNHKEDNSFDEFLSKSFVKSQSQPKSLKNISARSKPPPELTLEDSSSRPLPFIQVIRERYRQACRSVLIRTQNPESTVRALASFGPLKFAECVSQDKQYLIAEFSSESCVKKLQESSLFFFETKKFPLVSRCLFDESKGQDQLNRQKRGHKFLLSEENWHSSEPESYPKFASLDEELHHLSEAKGLNDLDIRARFLACVLVEDLFRPLLPEARIIPYGSCLNGFGWWDSDLDMMLCLQGDPYLPGVIKKPGRGGLPGNFKFLTEVFHTERLLAQKTLTMVASLLELGPRFNNVFKILNAHVPIVRFHCATLNLQCDVSVEAMDSIKMTELLYLYSSLDSRVRPLMSGIKQWAVSHGLTSSGEQQKPTTIGLLCLLVFYLQTRSPQVLPTLRALQNATAPSDMFYIDNVVYGIPSNPSVLPESENKETLESLLHGFFLFYSEFDFKSQAISIIEGSTFLKPANSSPLYVENPLSIGFNICKNVSDKYLEAFVDAMKTATRKMESLSEDDSTLAVGEDGSRMTPLCDGSFQGSKLSFLFNSDMTEGDQNVKIEVLDLFAEDGDVNNDFVKDTDLQEGKAELKKKDNDRDEVGSHSKNMTDSVYFEGDADSGHTERNNSSIPQESDSAHAKNIETERAFNKKR
ncbi:poly(A) RNA polymerase, mitochondrial [Elysia marginata]|uniref:Poly(A) RNA polymerase, mitochondrial n=1 Tax=Elysia marginata TaxID=1093978 RepID=A0AAV4FPP3_9GAST|nr:poly(A) RNA polymerase, mitochondrial [Elysia marginata]